MTAYNHIVITRQVLLGIVQHLTDASVEIDDEATVERIQEKLVALDVVLGLVADLRTDLAEHGELHMLEPVAVN